MPILIAVVAFVAVVVIALILWTAFEGESEQDKVSRRLESVRMAQARGTSSANLQLVRDELLSDSPTFQRVLFQMKWARSLQAFIDQSGIKIKAGHILVLSLVVAFGCGIFAFGMAQNVGIALLAAAIGSSVPFIFIAVQRHRRLRAFELHFPEALDLLSRAVRAGHAFTSGLEMIGTELSEPVAGEFRKAFEEQNLGLPLRDAFLNMSERIPSLDVKLFTTALMVQKETGGNLAEILDNVSKVIRERFRIYGEVRTRTAQGRLTALILILLPIMMALVLRSLNPDYINPLFTDPMGQHMLIGAIIAQILGAICIWKIVSIKV